MIENETFTPLEKKFVQAFENFDIEQLQETVEVQIYKKPALKFNFVEKI